MAKKKDRAFFICPRWNELASGSRVSEANIGVHAKTLTAIKAGQPVARATLRRALEMVRAAAGSAFDVDSYIVDRRTASSN